MGVNDFRGLKPGLLLQIFLKSSGFQIGKDSSLILIHCFYLLLKPFSLLSFTPLVAT